MNFDAFWSNILASLVAGFCLTFMFFVAREKLFPYPDIVGVWYMETVVDQTAYVPFEGMVLRYVMIVWREGSSIKGSAEKIYENSSTGERSYTGKNRSRVFVEGYIEKKYLGEDRLYLHLSEVGLERESTTFIDLLVGSSSAMSGAFNSMAASQIGTVEFQRTAF